MTCYYGGDDKDLSDAAGQILHVIMSCYPGHNVKVWGYKSGVFFITHLDFSQIGANWGMALKARQFYSASDMQRQIVTNFGEWLERANLKRGAANGDEVKVVEGVPLRNHADIPPEKPELDMDKLIDAGQRYLRDKPMPQVIAALKEKEEKSCPATGST